MWGVISSVFKGFVLVLPPEPSLIDTEQCTRAESWIKLSKLDDNSYEPCICGSRHVSDGWKFLWVSRYPGLVDNMAEERNFILPKFAFGFVLATKILSSTAHSWTSCSLISPPNTNMSLSDKEHPEGLPESGLFAPEKNSGVLYITVGVYWSSYVQRAW